MTLMRMSGNTKNRPKRPLRAETDQGVHKRTRRGEKDTDAPVPAPVNVAATLRRSVRVSSAPGAGTDNDEDDSAAHDSSDSLSNVSVDDLESLASSSNNNSCVNCRRQECEYTTATEPYSLHLQVYNIGGWRSRKKFKLFTIAGMNSSEREKAQVCSECLQYLDRKGSPAASNGALEWPAFVWSVLRRPDIYQKGWRLLPQEWRPWWQDAVCSVHGTTLLELAAEPCIFQDVTTELREDIGALCRNRWSADLMPREESLVLPTVKCVAGCSEFKHKCQHIAMDIVWEELLETELVIYSPSHKRECTNIFRKDYSLPDHILKNPRWLCKASIAQDRNGIHPVVLTCRHHNEKSKRFLVHPCRNPTGTVATEKSGQFAPVTAVPRTLQKAKAHQYSASFHMASLEGSFYGLDTMYLQSQGGNHHHQSGLAWRQEALCIKGRADMKGHIGNMARRKQIGPRLAADLLKSGDELFEPWNETKKKFELGGSYIGMDDAVKLQQAISLQGLEVATIHTASGNTKNVVFLGPWPRHLTWVHPAGDNWGRRFPTLPSFALKPKGVDARATWFLCGMVALVPEIFAKVRDVRKSDNSLSGR